MIKIRGKSGISYEDMKHEISISYQLEILLKRHVKHTPSTNIAQKNNFFIKQRLECPSLLDKLRLSAHLVALDLFLSFVCFCVEFNDCFLAFFPPKGSEDTWSLLDLVSITVTSSEVSKSSFSLLSSKKTE